MTNREKVLVLDFGGQYNQLIARRVRECNVYCEVKSYKMTLDEIRAFNPIGIIFTGGPNSVYEESSPKVDPKVFELGVPVLAKLPINPEINVLVDEGRISEIEANELDDFVELLK